MSTTWFETLKGLSEAEVREQLANNFITFEIVDVYTAALAAKNATVSVAAQDELLRRGDSDYVASSLMEFWRTVGLEPGTDFTNRIARSLADCECDPLLKRTGELVLNGLLRGDAENFVDELISELAKWLGINEKSLHRYGKYINLSDELTSESVKWLESNEEALRRYGKYINLSST